jgi:hypothetical protein
VQSNKRLRVPSCCRTTICALFLSAYSTTMQTILMHRQQVNFFANIILSHASTTKVLACIGKFCTHYRTRSHYSQSRNAILTNWYGIDALTWLFRFLSCRDNSSKFKIDFFLEFLILTKTATRLNVLRHRKRNDSLSTGWTQWSKCWLCSAIIVIHWVVQLYTS